jgi:hypothetical protein
MIPPKIAVAIGVHPGRAEMFRDTLTVSGKAVVPVVVVPRLQLFEHTFRRVPLTCHELPAECPLDGLLGLNLLTQLKAVLDLNRRRIRIPSHLSEQLPPWSPPFGNSDGEATRSGHA